MLLLFRIQHLQASPSDRIAQTLSQRLIAAAVAGNGDADLHESRQLIQSDAIYQLGKNNGPGLVLPKTTKAAIQHAHDH